MNGSLQHGVMISVVVPFYNEELNVRPLYNELTRVLDDIGRTWELIFINDGSRDNTAREIQQLQREDDRIIAVNLKGNQGQTAALSAGFDQARGEVIVSIDGDLQHDPKDLPAFIAAIDSGCDLASGWRKERNDPYWSRMLPSKIANRLMASLSGIPLHDFGTTFKAYRRGILQNIKLYGQFHRFIPVLVMDLKPSIVEVPINDRRRVHGKSNYNIKRTFTVFFDLIRIKFLASYLTRPLQIFGSLGVSFMTLGGLILFWLTAKKYLLGISIMETRAPLFLFSIFLVLTGIHFFSMGLLSEILVKLYYHLPGVKNYVLESVNRVNEENGEQLP